MKYGFLGLIVLFFSCGYEVDKKAKENLQKKNISLLLDNVCSIKKSEFSDLYDGNIRYESYDSFNSVLLDSLKIRGFEVVDVGWGNWEFGPRITTFTAKRDTCQCNVVKQYWADEAELKQVTETIECSSN